MKRPDALTSELLAHLAAFAAAHGRFWKRKLRDYWHGQERLTGLSEDQAAALQAARNSLAPCLNNFTTQAIEEWLEQDRYRKAAEAFIHRDGDCEIDADAKVSLGEDEGAYVQAWVWVPASLLGAVA